MKKNRSIYIVQFGTGTNINLLPLAGGQLVSRLKLEKDFLDGYKLQEIVFRRPSDPREAAAGLEDVLIIGFSCFLWNLNISLQVAREVRNRFPGALIVLGGPSIPKDSELVKDFFDSHPCIDVICTGEGEEVFVSLCKSYAGETTFADIPGIIYKDRDSGCIHQTAPELLPDMNTLPSPYLDGTFDELYGRNSAEFSGIIWETNRGCPYECAFCTWGNLPSRRIREKPIEQVMAEIEWIGRNRIDYIAMSDSNFGIRQRDLELAEMLAQCRKKYGSPGFISVSWAKHSPEKILEIARIFKECGIGFRVTQSLQSLNPEVVKAINRVNIAEDDYRKTRESYHRERLYSYTELILGLPMETYESFMCGIEQSLSECIYDQLYIYPLFLFPNTRIATSESRAKFGMIGRMIENRYTKSSQSVPGKEFVEIVTGHTTMPEEDWVKSFVDGYFTLALHDERLAFFILQFLKRSCGIGIVDTLRFAKSISAERTLPTLLEAFKRLENCARDVQKKGKSHLIEPASFGGVPFDPPAGIFLELLMARDDFYAELALVVDSLLRAETRHVDGEVMRDLFKFQSAVIAHPGDPPSRDVSFTYNWPAYFGYTHCLSEEKLVEDPGNYRVINARVCNGDPKKFLQYHYDIRGVPAFNQIADSEGRIVFPPPDTSSREGFSGD